MPTGAGVVVNFRATTRSGRRQGTAVLVLRRRRSPSSRRARGARKALNVWACSTIRATWRGQRAVRGGVPPMVRRGPGALLPGEQAGRGFSFSVAVPEASAGPLARHLGGAPNFQDAGRGGGGLGCPVAPA